MATSADALRKLTSGQRLTNAERELLGMAPVITGSASEDARKALTKLTGGQKLNDAERVLLNMSPINVEPIVSTTGDGKIIGEGNDGMGQGEDPQLSPTLTNTIDNGDGTYTNIYSDGTFTKTGSPRAAVQTSNNDALVQQLIAQQNAAAAKAASQAETQRQSAITILTERFGQYGLSSLATKIKELAIDGATEATITLGLQATDEYKTRFAANEARLKAGLKVLQPAEYLNLEDGYRQVLRSYGLAAFDNDAYVQQFIANDVSASELSSRVVTAVQRVQNADPAVSKQLKDFYGIGSSDMVAYVLDPSQQFQKIERQVAAAEIGVAGARQGLDVGVSVAEQLASQGITQAEAQKGYATIADILPTADKLSQIYGNVTSSYGQSEAEQEVFNSLASAQRARQKLTALELAQFGGSSGTSKTSLKSSTSGLI